LNELVDPSIEITEIEKQASKILTFKEDGSIASQRTVGEDDRVYTNIKSDTDKIGSSTTFNK
jgi:hypothetical protein